MEEALLVLPGAFAVYTLGAGSLGWCLVPARFVGAHVLGIAEYLSWICRIGALRHWLFRKRDVVAVRTQELAHEPS